MNLTEKYFSPQTGETKTGQEWQRTPYYKRLELVPVAKVIRRVK